MMRFATVLVALVLLTFTNLECLKAAGLCIDNVSLESIHPYQARVIIADEPIVEGNDIILGEIACIVGDDFLIEALTQVKVGVSPLVGQSRDINIPTLRLRLRQAGILDEMVEIISNGFSFNVKKAYQILSRDSIIQAVNKALSEKIGPNTKAEILVYDVEEIPIPIGEVTLNVLHLPAFWGNMVSVPVEIRVNGSLYKTLSVRTELILWQSAWVAMRRIDKGEKLGPHNVKQEQIQATSTLIPAQVSTIDLFRTNRIIQAGAVLEERFLERIPDILKGEPVIILARSKNIEVKVGGTVMYDTWVGQITTVRNDLTGQVLSGKLISLGVVEVIVP